MKHIKLFENYENTEKPKNQRTVFSRGEINVTFLKTILNPDVINKEDGRTLSELGLLDEEIPVEDYWVNEVIIEYDIQPIFSKFGIEDISLNLKSVWIQGTYDIVVGDDVDTFDFDITDVGPFEARAQISTEGLPFYPTEIDIDLSDLDELYPGQKSNIPTYIIKIGS